MTTDTTDTADIILTDTAAREIKSICQQQDLVLDNVYLKVGVKGGGCSGFSYILDLTETKHDQDRQFEKDGVRIICDPKSFLYLSGTEVDFKDEIMGRGFVFKNPNATSTCGCGSSFSA